MFIKNSLLTERRLKALLSTGHTPYNRERGYN
jgi:hypothetical protein